MTEDTPGPVYEVRPTRARRKSERKTEQRPADALESPRQETVIVLGDGRANERSTPPEVPWSGERNPLTVAFMMTLVFGVVVETITRIIPGESTATLIAGAAMVLYFVYGCSRPKSIRNSEQFADSLYYLGFILTLWALFVAMTPLLNGETAITSRNIIEKFGIAIMTTFVGMTLRILLLQMRQTATDQEEEARESIARYVANLNEEIMGALTEVKEFRKKVAGSTDAAIAQLSEIAGAVGKSVSDSNALVLKAAQASAAELESSAARSGAVLLTTVQRVVGTIENCVTDSGAAIRNSVQSATQSLGASVGAVNAILVGSVQEASKHVDSAMANLAKRLDAVEVPHDVFAERLKGLTNAFSGDFEKARTAILEQAASFTESLAASVLSVRRVSEELGAIHQDIALARHEIASANNVSANSAGSAQRLVEVATLAVEAMDRFQKNAAQLAITLGEVQEKLQSQGNEHARDMARAVGEFNVIVSDAKGGASQFGDTMINSAKLLRDALADVGQQK